MSTLSNQPDFRTATDTMRMAGTRSVRLAIERMSKSFGRQVAISDVSFSVHESEFVAILGTSGAGKTTLFRCVAGLVKPDDGNIRLAGSPRLNLQGRDRRRIAVVFQQFNLVNRLSALSNVLAGRLGDIPTWRGILHRFTRADILWALECLDRVGLLDKAEQRADRLSGGQQQRVAIARVICQRPEIIIADEPVASLDPQTSASILELLRGICREDRVAVICSLHQTDLACAYADRIVGLAHGRVVIDVAAKAFDAVAASLYGSAPEGEIQP